MNLQPIDQLKEAVRREQLRRIENPSVFNKIDSYYPDFGPLRRELYAKHMEFFEAGATHQERCFLAANRVGKTEGVGAYEVTLHLTGQYPHWWKGRRFDRATRWWVAGDTSKTVHEEILQPKLLGMWGSFGTGMIPKEHIIRWVPKRGVPEGVETCYVRHKRGGKSILTFKSYEQGRESFQGPEKDGVWCDEECERKIYTECLLRTMATVPGQDNGLMILTFTPLQGMTDIVRDFMGLNEEEKKFSTSTEDEPEAPMGMVEVYPGLFVGSQAELLNLRDRLSWEIVHAAKEPFHRQALGYKGHDPDNRQHPEFYIARRPHSISMNMVDAPQKKYFYPEMMDEAVRFISSTIDSGKRCFVHCNQGKSRGPGLALYWMWKRGYLSQDFAEAKEEFTSRYPRFEPGKGMLSFLEDNCQ